METPVSNGRDNLAGVFRGVRSDPREANRWGQSFDEQVLDLGKEAVLGGLDNEGREVGAYVDRL